MAAPPTVPVPLNPGHDSTTPLAWSDRSTPDVHSGHRRGPSRGQRCSRWTRSLLVVFFPYALLATSGIILLALGGGEAQGVAFRCDIVAACISMATVVILLVRVLWKWKRTRDGTYPAFPLRDVEYEMIVFLWANGVSFLFFALMAHATVFLAQVILVLCGFFYTLVFCSITVWAWRKGVEAPERGDPPLLELLLDVPRWRLLGLFCCLDGLALLCIHVKPRDKLALSTELGLLEHWFYLGIGGLLISAILCNILLVVMPTLRGFSVRRLLIYQYLPARGWEDEPTGSNAILRATCLSWGCHMFCAIFIAFCIYAVVTIVLVYIAKYALRKARPVKNSEDGGGRRCCSCCCCCRGRGRNSVTSGASSDDESSIGAREPSSASGVARRFSGSSDDDVDSRTVSRTSKKKKKTVAEQKKEKALRQSNSWGACVQRYLMASMMLIFGILKVSMLFFAFLFDVAFIQKALTSADSVHYKMINTNAICGHKLEYISVESDAEQCALKTKAEELTAFAMGTNATHKGFCYKITDLEVTSDVWTGLIHDFTRPCPDGDGKWTVMFGVDFYAIKPIGFCISSGRRLQSDAELKVSDEEVEKENGDASSSIGDSVANMFGDGDFGKGLGDFVDWSMQILKGILSIKARIPRDAFKCVGIRRLMSACMLLGGVWALMIVAVVDVLSVLSACCEIAKVRAGDCQGFMNYLIMVARPQLLEQLFLVIVQITINSMKLFLKEAFGVFSPSCGFLVTEDLHLEGANCPSIWAQPVDAMAQAIIFFAAICGLVLMCFMFGGFFYGLAPARWSIVTLFGSDLNLTHFGCEDEELPDLDDVSVGAGKITRSKTLSTIGSTPTRGGCLNSCCRAVMRPVMGLPTSLGIWIRWTSQGYQIGKRQDWYEPIDFEPDDADADGAELVSWKSMYKATSKGIALAWLPLPYGNLFSKMVLYLNEHVIFAFGDDGGGSSADPEQISVHFLEDTPPFAQLLHWVCHAAQFGILLVITFDLLPTSEDDKLKVLTICVIIVVGIAGLKVILDVMQELKSYTLSQGVVSRLEEIVEARIVEKIAAGLPPDEDDNVVFGVDLQELCPRHKTKLLNVCNDLLELKWIKGEEARLPKSSKAFLRSPKIRDSDAYKIASRFMAAEKKGVTIKPALMTACLLYVLHEAMETEIQKIRCLREAQRQAILRLHDASKIKSQHLQQWAEAQAKADIIAEASERVRIAEEAQAILAARRRRGMSLPDLPDSERWLALQFCTAATGTSVVTGKLIKGGREIIEPQKASGTIVVTGEVGIKWDEDQKYDGFGDVDVTINNVKVQMDLPPVPEDAEELPTKLTSNGSKLSGLSGEKEEAPDELKPLTTKTKSVNACEVCSQEDALAIPPGCCSTSSNNNPRHSQHDVRWVTTCLGISWAPKPKLAEDGDTGAGEQPTLKSMSSNFGGIGPTPLLKSKSKLSDGGSGSLRPMFSGILGLATNNTTFSVRRDDKDVGATWLQDIRPARAIRATIVAGHAKEIDDLEDLEEAALDHVGRTPQWLAGEFLEAIGEGNEKGAPLEKAGDAAKKTRLLAMAAKMAKRRRDLIGQHATARHGDTGRAMTPAREALANLERALAKVPLDADELSLALDDARRLDVDPTVLSKASRVFDALVRKQNAVFALPQAVESRFIKQMRLAIAEARDSGLTPDDAGWETLIWAENALREEELSAVDNLRSAIEKCDVRRLARAVENLGEIEGHDVHLVQRGEERLRELQNKYPLRLAANPADLQVAMPVSGPALALKQFRAMSSLRAALSLDPPDVEMLQTAVSQASALDLESPELDRAYELLMEEQEKEKLLQELRRSVASRKPGEVSVAISRCRMSGMDARKLLYAVAQLIEEQAIVSRVIADHGTSNIMLADLEKERCDLHNQIQEAYGGLRVLCRIRPLQLPDLELETALGPPPVPGSSEDSLSSATQLGQASVSRLDKRTVLVRTPFLGEETFRVGAVFGPECIQAEIWSEIRSLAQSAVDGYNISVLACGPSHGGKTFTMMGSAGEGRGVVPRMIDELFMIRDRDDWRASLEIKVQIAEVFSDRHLRDLLGGRSDRFGTSLHTQPLFASKDALEIAAVNISIRRIVDRYELKQLTEEAWWGSSSNLRPGRARHVLLTILLSRTNRVTGITTKGKIVIVDMAAMGQNASPDVWQSYSALQEVLQALSRQERHVPFRRHLLTKVLRDCMGGSSKTALILALPPGAGSAEDTLASIAFSSCGSW